MQSHYHITLYHCITPSHYTTASPLRITSLHYTTALRHCITPPHHVTALHHRITSLHHTTASRHCITPPHYVTASHHRITSLHYTIALRHCITPLRHNTRSTRSTAYTLGRHYKPISFHNRVIRHSRATLLPLNVPQQSRATFSGDVTAPKRSTTGPRDTLGRHYSP